jgi:hypothetical protein
MAAQMKVLGRVLTGGTVATAYVPALGATPQVQPPSAARQTLDTTDAAWFYSRIDASNALVLLFHAGRRSANPVAPILPLSAIALRLAISAAGSDPHSAALNAFSLSGATSFGCGTNLCAGKRDVLKRTGVSDRRGNPCG